MHPTVLNDNDYTIETENTVYSVRHGTTRYCLETLLRYVFSSKINEKKLAGAVATDEEVLCLSTIYGARKRETADARSPLRPSGQVYAELMRSRLCTVYRYTRIAIGYRDQLIGGRYRERLLDRFL